MAYTKTEWKARQGVNLNKYTKSQETEDSVVLYNTPDSITDAGTPFTAENMNHIEQGISDAHNAVAVESTAREQGESELARAISDGDADVLASAKNYADEAMQTEAHARERSDNELAQAISNEAHAREQSHDELARIVSAIETKTQEQNGDDAIASPPGAASPEATLKYVNVAIKTEGMRVVPLSVLDLDPKKEYAFIATAKTHYPLMRGIAVSRAGDSLYISVYRDTAPYIEPQTGFSSLGFAFTLGSHRFKIGRYKIGEPAPFIVSLLCVEVLPEMKLGVKIGTSNQKIKAFQIGQELLV